jgi:hypothetical protein
MPRKRRTTPPPPSPSLPSRHEAWFGRAAQVAVALTAFALGFHKVDDFDTWWHLAAGRWIATHGAIPATDTLSHTVPDHPWINLQWGFDVLLYWLHQAGGPMLLSLFCATVYFATTVVLLRLAARHAGPALGALSVFVAILAAHERVTLRPELLSFFLLACVLTVLDRAARTDGRGLFLLVPLMIVWANVHALFVIGVFAIGCALIGSGRRPSSQLLRWGIAAVAAVLLNPWGLEGAWFPVKLLSRIDGSAAVFQTVGEFASPWADGAAGQAIVFYKILLVSGAVVAMAALLLAPRRAGLAGDALFFIGLAVLSTGARRNIAIFAVGAAPFIARCLEVIVGASSRFRARTLRFDRAVAGATVLAAAMLAATVVTGAFYRAQNSPQEFGAGVVEGTFPVRAAAFARAAALPPRLYNDMASGGYLTWDPPVNDGVFVDGRLEVYDTDFLTNYVIATSNAARWNADADRYGIQTAIIFHRFENDRMLAGRLAGTPGWSLVYSDEVAAIFVRTAGNADALARAAALRPEWDRKTDDWLSRPVDARPYPAGRVEGTRAYARWLATIGQSDGAIKAYTKLLELGIPAAEEIERRLMLGRYFKSRGQLAQAHEQARAILAIEPAHVEARQLLR